MATSMDDIVSQIRDALRVSDPELDTSVGSVLRKIIDAFASNLAGAYIQNHLLSYAYDVDAKVGADLDAFCALFGIMRIPARRAVGTVTFTRDSSLTDTVYIPVGTEVTASSNSALVAQAITGGVMLPGVTSVSVAVQASTAGPDGNMAAGVLNVISSPIQGVTSVVNTNALTGGTSQETDSELRARWKATVFRSLAGTEAMFAGVALDDTDCYAANVVGSSKSRTEILQVPSSGDTTTQITDAAFIYSEPVRVTTSDGTALSRDFDYSWITSNPPAVHALSGQFPASGSLITVEYPYLPKVSRNDPTNGITNRVDVFVGGVRAQVARQTLAFSSSKTFQNTNSSQDFYTSNWVRVDQTTPDPGNVFIPLAYGPILAVPDTLVVGSTTYGRATKSNPLGTVTAGITYAYTIIHEDTSSGWTATSRFGLEWHRNYLPSNGTAFTVGQNSDYAYNEVPASVQDAVDRWRLVGSDVKVHQAKQRWLRFALGIVYTQGASQSTVQDGIRAALGDFLNGMGFNASVQVSDVLSVIHSVPGVDNVRFLNGSDVTGYSSANPNTSIVGIQQIAPIAGAQVMTPLATTQWSTTGNSVGDAALASYVDAATGRPKDVYFQDSELPVLGGIVFQTMARNSFGVA